MRKEEFEVPEVPHPKPEELMETAFRNVKNVFCQLPEDETLRRDWTHKLMGYIGQLVKRK